MAVFETDHQALTPELIAMADSVRRTADQNPDHSDEEKMLIAETPDEEILKVLFGITAEHLGIIVKE